jgi:wyosine [tRNA(Phe)-imidazoG37] synthetase (radical SAM superfamily)
MYKHLFGPVPSRRLGMSLGVDLVPHKVCSLNCIYCECGATTRLTTARDEYVPVEEVLEELNHFFGHHPDPDFITFSGAGEPTLNSRFGEVLSFIKREKPGIRTAVLTNGTLFSDPSVRRELLQADVVLPSLDAATNVAFRKINRPPNHLTADTYIAGLIEFRKEYRGEMWLEVFILPGYNDDPGNLAALRESIISLKPDRVQLNTLDRPGVIGGLRPATREELEKIVSEWKLNGADAGWEPEKVEIVAPAVRGHDEPSYRDDIENAIFETISRRPCTLEDIRDITGIHLNEINKYLASLEKSGRVVSTRQERGVFYKVRQD